VDVIEVDPLDAEAAQRLIEVPGDLGPAERRFARRAAMRIADLGCDLRAADEAIALSAEPFAEDDLARSAAVGVRGVEAAKADAAGMVEQLKRLRFAVAGVAQVRRRADPAEISAAEDDAGEVGWVQDMRPSIPPQPNGWGGEPCLAWWRGNWRGRWTPPPFTLR
jgi:hypothetical protein